MILVVELEAIFSTPKSSGDQRGMNVGLTFGIVKAGFRYDEACFGGRSGSRGREGDLNSERLWAARREKSSAEGVRTSLVGYQECSGVRHLLENCMDEEGKLRKADSKMCTDRRLKGWKRVRNGVCSLK